MRTWFMEHSSLLLALLRTLLVRVMTAVRGVLRRRRRSTEHLVAQGRRLAELMAQQEHLMTLMLAKHHPFAPASAVAGEARRLAPLMAEIESAAVELRRAPTPPTLREATDRLLDEGLRAAEFARDVSRWRRVDMTAWHTTTGAWAAERVRFRHELDALK